MADMTDFIRQVKRAAVEKPQKPGNLYRSFMER